MRMVQSRRVDALIVAHTLDHDPRLEQLQAAGFPFLALGRSQLPQPYAWFDFDNYAGTYQATRWLIEKAISGLRFWAKATIRHLSPSVVRAFWTPCGKPGFPANGCAPCRHRAAWVMPPRMNSSLCRNRLRPSLPTATPTATARRWRWHSGPLNRRKRGVAGGLRRFAAGQHRRNRRGIGDPVHPSGRGKQIADMVRQLINGDDITQLQVLWQPEFSQARRPKYSKFPNPITNPKRFGCHPKRFGSTLRTSR
jgi:LacI family transcriptional regulator